MNSYSDDVCGGRHSTGLDLWAPLSIVSSYSEIEYTKYGSPLVAYAIYIYVCCRGGVLTSLLMVMRLP
jgi:hypothetical protein